MTLEKLNLQITTPEDDNNTDPEFIRLQGELMALKQPLLDAIANKDLPNAEELHAKALGAKAKLEEYKESLNKKEEYKTIEINGVQVELGPDLGQMPWHEIPARLEDLNKTLKPGEKPWRVPTKEEYEEIGKPINEIWNTVELSQEQSRIEVKKYLQHIGFPMVAGKYYWTATESVSNPENSAYWYPWNSFEFYGSKSNYYCVRCIR